MHWNTEAMKDLIFTSSLEAGVAVGMPGGDYDTEVLTVNSDDGEAEAVVFAMNAVSQVVITNPKDTKVDQLFVTFSPRSGMEAAEPADMHFIANLIEVFNKAGYASTQQGWKSFF